MKLRRAAVAFAEAVGPTSMEAIQPRRLIIPSDDGIVVVMRTPRRIKSSRGKLQARRRRVRKPSQIPVVDVRSEAFSREAHRQSLAVARSPHAADDQAFVDAISEWNDE